MKLNINKDKIQEAFEHGELIGLDEIETQLENSEEVEQELFDLVTCLYKLNFVYGATERKGYVEKYNEQIENIFLSIKNDLFDILQIEQ